jgi:hypothetical protein
VAKDLPTPSKTHGKNTVPFEEVEEDFWRKRKGKKRVATRSTRLDE